jgi:sporulation protein YtfJ
MNNEMPLKQIIDASLSKIGSVADVNTVIGEPIHLPDGVIVIPFSKVSVGFASGGAEYDGKNKDAKDGKESDKAVCNPHFAGGNGAGVSVTPLGFLVIDKDGVRMLDLKHDASFESADPVNKVLNTINSIIDKGPSLAMRIKDLFSKKKEEKPLDEAVEEAVEKAFDEKDRDTK